MHWVALPLWSRWLQVGGRRHHELPITLLLYTRAEIGLGAAAATMGKGGVLRCRHYLDGNADIGNVHLVKALCVAHNCCVTLLPDVFHYWLHLQICTLPSVWHMVQ